MSKKYRHTKAVKILIDSWKERILSLKKDNVNVRSIVADCVTIDGVKLAKYMNGKLVFKNETSNIYEFGLEND